MGFKSILIGIIIGAIGAYSYVNYSHDTEYKNKISVVKNSFKLGCEIALLKNNIKEKEICIEFLKDNKKVLNNFIKKTK